jgi:hypothetical protein
MINLNVFNSFGASDFKNETSDKWLTRGGGGSG